MGTPWQCAAVARRATSQERCDMLVFGIALLLLGACSSRSDGFAGDATLAGAEAPLAFSVNAAKATHRLATSTMETKEAAPGSQFVVLDVSVTNRDADPQVLLEGKLIAMGESDMQTFDTPVAVFSNDYLSVQVLSPEERVRGKIAYEVPQHLPGVLYWSPGSGSERILLHVMPPREPQRTLADAGFDDAIAPTIADTPDSARHAPVPRTASASSEPTRAPPPTLASAVVVPRPTMHTTRAAATVEIPASTRHRASTVIAPTQARATTLPISSMLTSRVAAGAPPSSTITTGHDVRPMPAPMQASAGAAATSRVIALADARVAASVAESTPVPPRNVATIMAPRSMELRTPLSTPTLPPGPAPEDDPEQIRQLACQGLVTRNDPWEKSNNLGFFNASCREYPLPSRWQPHRAPRSLLARMSAALAGNARTAMAGHAPACDTPSHASRLVCQDAVLSAMDIQLDRSVQRASHYVSPIALQRDQAQWSGRIRNACETAACLQQAYRRQQARIDALIPAGRAEP